MTKPARSMHMDIVEQRALAANRYRVTIAANEKVRQPPELDFAGLSTENYTKNPVVMWAHDAVGRSPSGGLPIGRTLSLHKAPEGKLIADFEFLDDDDFAQRVKNAWDKGFLQAASISWIPAQSVPAGDGARRDTRAELLEWSIVSVPSDPDALRESHRRMMDAILREPAVGPLLHQPTPPRDEDERSTPTLRADQHQDLRTAFELLRYVVEGPCSQRARPSADGEPAPADLVEVRELVSSLKSAMLSVSSPPSKDVVTVELGEALHVSH